MFALCIFHLLLFICWISNHFTYSKNDTIFTSTQYVSAISNPVGIKEEDREVGGGDQFISLGIAEVSLPISFKLNNIEETDDTMNKIEAARRLKYGGKRVESLYPNSGVAAIPAIGTARFWNPSMSSFVQQVEKDKQKAIESKNATSGPGSNSEQKSNSATDSNDKPTDGKRRNHSSDDRAMNMFKSNQRNRK